MWPINNLPLVNRLFGNECEMPANGQDTGPRKFGLHQVYPGDDSIRTDIDIVAIHGLDAQSPRTWVAWKKDGDPSSGEVHWLRDQEMLPSIIKNARILTYDWNANLDDNPASDILLGHADVLLDRLHINRSKKGSNRPIIFIASCFGGLLLAKALHRAREHREYQDILRLTVGVAFLGTPFQGSNDTFCSAAQQRIAVAVSMAGDGPNKLVEYLKNETGGLGESDELVQRFRETVEDDEFKFPMVCFYETQVTDFGNIIERLPAEFVSQLRGRKTGILVPKSSACLHGLRDLQGLDVRHALLNKYRRPDDDAFVRVSYRLKKFADEAQKTLQAKCGQGGRGSSVSQFLVPYTSNLDFVGRSGILGQLKDLFGYGPAQAIGTSQTRVSLYGLGGVGKTQIALAYVYWLRESCPEVSIFWVHASSAERFRQAYTSIAEQCHIPGCDDPKTDLLPLVKTWLQSKDRSRWLMVIDSADDHQLFSSPGNLGQFVPECAHGSILVTTRNKVAGLKLSRSRWLIEVEKMDERESKLLLQGKLKADGLDPDDLLSLLSRLEHLPLALVQAAAFIQEMSITVNEYLRLLKTSDQHLVDLLSEEFETVGRDSATPHAVVETWILSFEQIQRQHTLAGELLSLISLFDRQAIPRTFLSDYGERQQAQELRGEIQLVKALGVLKAFSFITEDKDCSFNMHRLVQLVTRKWLDRKGRMHQFAAKALLVVSHNYPYGSYENWAVCSAYLPHVSAVLKLKGTGSRDERLARASLLHCAAGFYNYQGQWRDTEEFLVQSGRILKELRGEEHPSTLASMGNLASTYKEQGRWKEAESLEVQVMETSSRVLGEEHPDTLTSMANLASTYRDQGRWKEAESLDVQVMEMRKRVLGEEHPSTLTSMANLASTYRNQGR